MFKVLSYCLLSHISLVDVILSRPRHTNEAKAHEDLHFAWYAHMTNIMYSGWPKLRPVRDQISMDAFKHFPRYTQEITEQLSTLGMVRYYKLIHTGTYNTLPVNSSFHLSLATPITGVRENRMQTLYNDVHTWRHFIYNNYHGLNCPFPP